MTALPVVTIVTPSLNQNRFLEECIESVLTQGYTNIEYIVVDGGSTDGSVETIKRHEAHLAHWVSESDGGQSDAINKGFRAASGELVSWLNVDDYLLSDAVTLVVEKYLSQRSSPFFYGNGYRVDEQGNRKQRFYANGTVRFNYRAMQFGLNYIMQPSTFINRACLEQVGFVDTSLHYGMDSDLWLKLARLGEPAALAECLSASREYSETKTSTGSFARVEELRKVGERHSGEPITPGSLLYYLDCLNGYITNSRAEGSNVYSEEYLVELQMFWRRTAKLLQSLGLGPDGLPLETIEQGTTNERKP